MRAGGWEHPTSPQPQSFISSQPHPHPHPGPAPDPPDPFDGTWAAPAKKLNPLNPSDSPWPPSRKGHVRGWEMKCWDSGAWGVGWDGTATGILGLNCRVYVGGGGMGRACCACHAWLLAARMCCHDWWPTACHAVTGAWLHATRGWWPAPRHA